MAASLADVARYSNSSYRDDEASNQPDWGSIRQSLDGSTNGKVFTLEQLSAAHTFGQVRKMPS